MGLKVLVSEPLGDVETLSEEVLRLEGRSGDPTWPNADPELASASALFVGLEFQMDEYHEGLADKGLGRLILFSCGADPFETVRR